MDFLKVEGKTVDAAVEKAIAELNIAKEDAYVKVLEEGSNGFLGLGAKPAIVEVSEKFSIKNTAEPFMKNFVKSMGLNIDFVITQNADNKIEIDFVGDEVKYLIGKRGATLNAIQEFLNLSFNKMSNYRLSVIVNTGDYREKRKETLEKLAKSIADRVLDSKKPYTLNAMSSFERKVIHTALQGTAHIETSSIGEEPNRKVVVSYVD
ncbi:MAG: protein jag [Clostridia bacterium]|nr:protein jag [Clostridia bacterium]